MDLVDLVDVDDALLGRTKVAIGCLDQPGQQALNVLADVPGFGQAGGITDGEGDVEVGSQGLRPDGSCPNPKDRSGGCWTFQRRTSRRSASAMIGSGASRSQVSTRRL